MSEINVNPMTDSEAVQIPSASLAYLGDVIYELMVREMLVRDGSKKPSVDALKYVTAPAQSAGAERILPLLTEDETGVFRRGRNSVKSGFPKHASPSEYKKATGFEALFGYLYLTGREARARELFNAAFNVQTPDVQNADVQTADVQTAAAHTADAQITAAHTAKNSR